MLTINFAGSILLVIILGMMMENCVKTAAACTTDADCKTGELNVCVTTTCKCIAGYKENGTDPGKCIVDDIFSINCTNAGNTACTKADPNSLCATNKCQCKAGYMKNATDTSKCIVVFGTVCQQPGDCPAESNTHCPATSKKVCTCNQNFTESGGICTANTISNINNNQNQNVRLAISTTTCTQNGGECKASNSVCDRNVGHCTCSDGFLPSSPVGDTCVKDSAAVTTRFAFSSLGVSMGVFIFLHIIY